MTQRSLSWLALGLILGLALAACSNQGSASNAIRRAVIEEMLTEFEVDDLVIRLQQGWWRENFDFKGNTIFLVGPVREAEFWEIHDLSRTYLFIEDIEYGESQKLAAVGIELYRGPGNHLGYTMELHENNGSWEVVRISGPVPCPCPR